MTKKASMAGKAKKSSSTGEAFGAFSACNASDFINYVDRFADALRLLCSGNKPPMDMVTGWIDGTDEYDLLQNWAAVHGPDWAQGLAVIDAAHVMADQPCEGEGYLMLSDYKDSRQAEARKA